MKWEMKLSDGEKVFENVDKVFRRKIRTDGTVKVPDEYAGRDVQVVISLKPPRRYC